MAKKKKSAQDAKRKAIENFIKRSSDEYYNMQEAVLKKARDSQISELEKAYMNAVQEGRIGIDEARDMFAEASTEIHDQAYLNSQSTDLLALQNGIQNSQQLLGLKAGDNARENELINTQMSERDSRISDIRNRLDSILNQKNLDVVGAKNDFNNNLAQARAQSQMMYNEQMGGLLQGDYVAERDHNYELDKMSTQQRYVLEQMAKQYGYDIKKMDKEQIHALSRMAKQHGYDLDKMSKQHSYNKSLAKYSGGGGGGGASKKKTYSPSSSNKVSPASKLQSYRSSTKSSGLKAYENKQRKLTNHSVVRRDPVPAPKIGQNQSMSAWEKMQYLY